VGDEYCPKFSTLVPSTCPVESVKILEKLELLKLAILGVFYAEESQYMQTASARPKVAQQFKW